MKIAKYAYADQWSPIEIILEVRDRLDPRYIQITEAVEVEFVRLLDAPERLKEARLAQIQREVDRLKKEAAAPAT